MSNDAALINLPVPQTAEAVLTVSQNPEDQGLLGKVLSRSAWRLVNVGSRKEAITFLLGNTTPVVVSESKLSDGTWKDVLADLKSLQNPPRLIVTSDLADERLWAEVLNFGAYDVLAKPFHPAEILRIISLAWRDWKEALDRTRALTPRLAAGSF
jgi:DNA-binding response OmpR family regulator